MRYFPKSEIAKTCYITHTVKNKIKKRKKKEKESEIMNRKGIVESNEKQDVVVKDNPVKTIHLPYKWVSQSRFSL